MQRDEDDQPYGGYVDISSELMKEYLLDSREHTSIIEQIVVGFESGKEPSRNDIDLLFRSFHTLKGNSALVGVTEVQELNHVTEAMIGKVRGGEIQINPTINELVLDAVDMMKTMIRELEMGGTINADATDIRQKIKSYTDNIGKPSKANAAAAVETKPVEVVAETEKIPPIVETIEVPEVINSQPEANGNKMEITATDKLAIINIPNWLTKNMKQGLLANIRNFRQSGIEGFIFNYEGLPSIPDDVISTLIDAIDEICSSGGRVVSCNMEMETMFGFNNLGGASKINVKGNLKEAVLALDML